MSDIEQRIAASFGAQRLMETLGARLALVADGEVHIALPWLQRLSGAPLAGDDGDCYSV